MSQGKLASALSHPNFMYLVISLRSTFHFQTHTTFGASIPLKIHAQLYIASSLILNDDKIKYIVSNARILHLNVGQILNQ